jgi:hypothetical protein
MCSAGRRTAGVRADTRPAGRAARLGRLCVEPTMPAQSSADGSAAPFPDDRGRAGKIVGRVVAIGITGLARYAVRWLAVVAAGLAGNAVTSVLPAGDAAVPFRCWPPPA